MVQLKHFFFALHNNAFTIVTRSLHYCARMLSVAVAYWDVSNRKLMLIQDALGKNPRRVVVADGNRGPMPSNPGLCDGYRNRI